VAGRVPGGAASLATDPEEATGTLVPCLLLQRGEVYLPGEDGPVPARTADGGRFDPFDVVDRLTANYSLIYLVDLDGVARAEPQLDLIQELSRDATLWVDGGVRNAEQAIDILVAGAHRAVLSSAMLRDPRELRRSWRLTTELVFEVEVTSGGLTAAPAWETSDPAVLAAKVRETGPDHIVLSPRGIDPDWELVRSVASGGPTWVDGAFSVKDAGRLAPSGARGGIFHIRKILKEMDNPPPPEGTPAPPARDDDNENQLIRDE
jgi:Histidine biosynthesis protein